MRRLTSQCADSYKTALSTSIAALQPILHFSLAMNIIPLSRSSTPLHPIPPLLPRSLSLRSSRLKPSPNPQRLCPPLGLADLCIGPARGEEGRRVRTSKVMRRRYGGWTERAKAEKGVQLRSIGERFTLFVRTPQLQRISPFPRKAFRTPNHSFLRKREPPQAPDSPEVSRWVGSSHDSPLVLKRR